MVKYVTIAILLIIIAAVSFLHHAKGLSFYRIFTRLFSGMTFAVLVFIVLFVVLKGAMSFRPEMLSF